MNKKLLCRVFRFERWVDGGKTAAQKCRLTTQQPVLSKEHYVLQYRLRCWSSLTTGTHTHHKTYPDNFVLLGRSLALFDEIRIGNATEA
jgi:hypothetical protein